MISNLESDMNDKEPDAMATFFEFWIDNVAQFSLTAVGVLMNLTIIGIISSKRYVFCYNFRLLVHLLKYVQN